MKREIPHPSPLLTGGSKSVGPLGELMSVQLRRVDILLTRGFLSAGDGLNLRSGMIACLGLIAANPGISQKELSEQTGRDKSIIASLVTSLEERGWTRRTRSTIDHRRYQLVATEQGENYLETFAQHIRKEEEALLRDVSAEDLATVSAILKRMHNSCVATLREMAEN